MSTELVLYPQAQNNEQPLIWHIKYAFSYHYSIIWILIAINNVKKVPPFTSCSLKFEYPRAVIKMQKTILP